MGTEDLPNNRPPAPKKIKNLRFFCKIFIFSAQSIELQLKTYTEQKENSMSEFYFTCPHCNAKICAEDEMIGQSGPCPGCGRKVTAEKNNLMKKTEKPNASLLFKFFLILLILLNIQFAVMMYFVIKGIGNLENKSDELLKKDKITDCIVKHFDREQWSFGIENEVKKMIQGGYEPIGKLCNDGINGAYYLFIKRGK